jgi:hypothetical protein
MKEAADLGTHLLFSLKTRSEQVPHSSRLLACIGDDE